MNALTYEQAVNMPLPQQQTVHMLVSRGWKFMYLGAISNDAYLESLDRRIIAVTRDGSQEKVA